VIIYFIYLKKGPWSSSNLQSNAVPSQLGFDANVLNKIQKNKKIEIQSEEAVQLGEYLVGVEGYHICLSLQQWNGRSKGKQVHVAVGSNNSVRVVRRSHPPFSPNNNYVWLRKSVRDFETSR
jgi:hypothetical protein